MSARTNIRLAASFRAWSSHECSSVPPAGAAPINILSGVSVVSGGCHPQVSISSVLIVDSGSMAEKWRGGACSIRWCMFIRRRSLSGCGPRCRRHFIFQAELISLPVPHCFPGETLPLQPALDFLSKAARFARETTSFIPECYR